MYIEDLIIALAISRNLTINPYDLKLIHSFHDQIFRGLGFTEKQELLSVKILKRQVLKLDAIFGRQISPFLENPTFRLARRTVTSSKQFSIVPHALYGKAIKAEFPYNENLLTKIRQEKSKLNYSQWDPEQKSWFFSLDEHSLNLLGKIASDESFTVDEEFENYQNQIKEIENNIEQYVPMITFNDKKLEFLNISPKIPQPTNSNIIENLFYARKLGIFTWDESIEETEEWMSADPAVRTFLQTDPKAEFSINLEKITIYSIKDIVKHLLPVLIVIPGGTELEKVEQSIEFLKTIGITSKEISVLFRLPSETGGKFNNFIRENNLNSPVTENTKVVFISSKVPKTLIEKKIKFNLVVNFNFYNIHYSIKNLLKWHHNVIHMMEKKQQRTLNFGDL
jgi:hypothetical protein